MSFKNQLKKLKETYPDATYYLDFDTPFHLVMATILSAQCRDVIVNKRTPALFERYKTPQDVLDSSEEEIVEYIKGITYFQAKAKYIMNTSRTLVEEFKGEVPKEIKDLTKLSGVGKKTANSIQQNAFNMVNGVVVDTHVIRISQRLGWSDSKNPDKIEKDLMKIFPQCDWKVIPHLLKNLGQKICRPKPNCEECPLKERCPSAFNV